MQEDTILGRYLSNVFLIEFPAHVKIVDKETAKINIKSPQDHATFVHEYWHFLMNVSTLARFQDFTFFQKLISILTRALLENNDGTVDSYSLSESTKEELDELTELYSLRYFQVDYFEGLTGTTVDDFKITGEFITSEVPIKIEGEEIIFNTVKIPVEAKTENGIEQGYYHLGNNTIDESIANSVEKMVFDDGTIPPAKPYLFLKKLSEYFNDGIALNNYELAALGTLSFLTHKPLLEIKGIFIIYIELKKSFTISDSLEILSSVVRPSFEEKADNFLDFLNNLQIAYEGRDLIQQAFDQVINRMLDAIKMRLDNLLFDLEAFKNTYDEDKLDQLIEELAPSCDIKQEFEGNEDTIMRDIVMPFVLESVNVKDKQISTSFLMRVLHCQMHFFESHFALHGGFADTDKTNDSTCPYYTCCSVHYRQNQPHTCKTKPWYTYSQEGENCAYGIAIGTLMGPTEINFSGN